MSAVIMSCTNAAAVKTHSGPRREDTNQQQAAVNSEHTLVVVKILIK